MKWHRSGVGFIHEHLCLHEARSGRLTDFTRVIGVMVYACLPYFNWPPDVSALYSVREDDAPGKQETQKWNTNYAEVCLLASVVAADLFNEHDKLMRTLNSYIVS